MPSPQQSPINIAAAYPADLGDRGLDVRYRGRVSGLVVKEKDGAKVQMPRPYTQQVRLGGERFDLASFHFHHPSEHLIDGQPYDMELHLVHTLVGDGVRYVVVAVMIRFDEGAADPHENLHRFFHAVATILKFEDPEGVPEPERRVTFDPNILLPDNPERQPYWRYEGSLTTPEFDEAVSWVVMPPIKIKKSYFDELGLLRHIEKPARPPQPLFRRFVLVNTPAGSMASGTGEMAASPTGTPKKGVKKRG